MNRSIMLLILVVSIIPNKICAQQSITGIENGHEWVDLGLPSGRKWATMNIGATKQSEIGNIYQWGNTDPGGNYDGSRVYYKWSYQNNCGYYILKYNNKDRLTTLELKDDAANSTWNGKWRMPTSEETSELISNCSWSSSIIDGINGYLGISNTNGNSIFLPISNSGPSFWTSSVVVNTSTGVVLNNENAYCFVGTYSIMQWTRYYSIPIRAVVGDDEEFVLCNTVHVNVKCESSYGSITFSNTAIQNSVLSIQASAPECSQFVKWSDGDTSNPRSLPVNQDTTLTAIFEKIQFKVSVDTDDAKKGAVDVKNKE